MSFRRYVQAYVQQLRQRKTEEGDPHPTTEALFAYHRRELPAEQADEVQEHLATCSECAELFLGLVNFLEWDLDSTRLSAEDIADSWEEFLRRTGQEESDALPVEA
jgi:hypothetical protein